MGSQKILWLLHFLLSISSHLFGNFFLSFFIQSTPSFDSMCWMMTSQSFSFVDAVISSPQCAQFPMIAFFSVFEGQLPTSCSAAKREYRRFLAYVLMCITSFFLSFIHMYSQWKVKERGRNSEYFTHVWKIQLLTLVLTSFRRSSGFNFGFYRLTNIFTTLSTHPSHRSSIATSFSALVMCRPHPNSMIRRSTDNINIKHHLDGLIKWILVAFDSHIIYSCSIFISPLSWN